MSTSKISSLGLKDCSLLSVLAQNTAKFMPHKKVNFPATIQRRHLQPVL
jgi:hypothetical protein